MASLACLQVGRCMHPPHCICECRPGLDMPNRLACLACSTCIAAGCLHKARAGPGFCSAKASSQKNRTSTHSSPIPGLCRIAGCLRNLGDWEGRSGGQLGIPGRRSQRPWAS